MEKTYNPGTVKNPILYYWRIIGKILSFLIFGLGSVLLSLVALPVMRIIFPTKKSFSKATRHFVSLTFRFFINVMSLMNVADIKVSDKKALRNLKSAVVVANHPSLLDVVMLISQIPNADAVVNAYLRKNILTIICSTLFIINDVSHEELIEKCKKSIESGNVLIIFPEGTRSLTTGQNPYKKGAARVAYAAKCPIIPVYMGGNDKRGLRKHDPMFMFNTDQKYHYVLDVKEPIQIEKYLDLEGTIAAKRITDEIRKVLSDENNPGQNQNQRNS